MKNKPAFHKGGTLSGTPDMNRKPRIHPVNKDLERQTPLAFSVPKKEYKGEIKRL
jgi:hypothetical protein